MRKKRSRKRVPGGKSRLHVRKKKGSKHKCALCRAMLHGTPHGLRPAEVRKMRKSKRRPTAAFAGVLCGKCRRNVFSEAAKVSAGFKKNAGAEFRLKPYVDAAAKMVSGGEASGRVAYGEDASV